MEWSQKRASGQWIASLVRRIWWTSKACLLTITHGRNYLSGMGKPTGLPGTLKVSQRCFLHSSRSHPKTKATSCIPTHKCLILIGCHHLIQENLEDNITFTINLGMRANWSQQKTMTKPSTKWVQASTAATRPMPLCHQPTLIRTAQMPQVWLWLLNSKLLSNSSSSTTRCTTSNHLKTSNLARTKEGTIPQ